MKSIQEFKPGDIITRLEPSKSYGGKSYGDRSYMGEKLIFVGITNGQIYVRLSKCLFGPRLIDLALDIWSEGWDFYQDPEVIFKDILDEIRLSENEEENVPKKSLETLQNELATALANEDYELVRTIQNKIDQIEE